MKSIAMWGDSSTIRLIVFTCLLGFAVFCASYAWLVWKRRNKSVSSAPRDIWARLRGWCMASAVCGVLLLGISLVIREGISNEGTMATEGMHIARSVENGTVSDVHAEGLVKKGDVLVRYSTPKMLSDLKEEEVKLAQLKAERQALPNQPLKYDSELVRRHQNAVSDKRTQQAALNAVLTAREDADRDLKQLSFLKEENLTKVDGSLKTTENEIKQAQERLNIAERQLERELRLVRVGAIALNEVDERVKETKVLKVEVEKLTANKNNIAQQRTQLADIALRVEKMTKDQVGTMQVEYERIKKELVAANKTVEEYEQKLKADEVRALEVQKNDIAKIDLTIQAEEARINGFKDRLEVKAPFAGKVFYAHPSGAAAVANQPLVVLGPEDGFRLLVRVPDSQVPSLRNAGTVNLDMGEGQLARKVSATFRKTIDIPAEPEMKIAEMTVNPTSETAKLLAEDPKVKAKLAWRFPLWTFWPFQLGLMLLGIGAIGFLLSVTLGTATQAIIPPAVAKAPVLKAPVLDAKVPAVKVPEVNVPAAVIPSVKQLVPSVALPAVSVSPVSVTERPKLAVPPVTIPGVPMISIGNLPEKKQLPPIVAIAEPMPMAFGGEAIGLGTDSVFTDDTRQMIRQDPIEVGVERQGELLELLAIRLRESIHNEQLESDLVESAEWALDNHGGRASRVFRRVFREDTKYPEHMQSIIQKMERSGMMTPRAMEHRGLVDRTIRILDSIGAGFLAPVA